MFQLLKSTIQIKSARSCVQTISHSSFYHRENFGLNTFRCGLENEDWFTGTKPYNYNFLRILQSTFPMLQLTVQIKSAPSSAQTIRDYLFYNHENFSLNAFRCRLENQDWFTGTKFDNYSFLRILQSTFPMLQLTVQIKSAPSSAQTISDSSFYHRENFDLNTCRCRMENVDWFATTKPFLYNFSRILQDTFQTLQSTVKIKSAPSCVQTIPDYSFYYHENFGINTFRCMLKPYNYNFLRILQSTFPILKSTVQIKSTPSCARTISDCLFNHREYFGLNTFRGSQFFADSAKYVSIATVHSWNGIKPFFYSNNDDDFF